MNHRIKFLLPDKSFWIATDREQREALSSKYTILCPPILFTEIARHGLSPRNPWLNLENTIVISHWLDEVKRDLLTEESAKTSYFLSTRTTKSILEGPEQELLEFEEVSDKSIEMLIKSTEFYRNLDSIINPLKEGLLSLIENVEDLSEEEWIKKLKEAMRSHQKYYPEIERILKEIETKDFRQEGKERLRVSTETFYDTYNADSLENANQIITRIFNHDSNDCGAAHEKLQRLCRVFRSILTQDERTQIFNRFLKEDMPHISRFAPYALGVAIWTYTIQLYLRENPKNTAPKDVLRDATYLLYTAYKDTAFVSADKWHRKFVDEVPLFEGVRENFIFVDLTTKVTIQEGFSKLL